MVIGFKMVTKMRLKELNRVLERIKEKFVKSKQDSIAAKRKGKEPMDAPVKRKRSLILQNEDNEDEMTLSTLKNLKSFVSFRETREETERREEEEEKRKMKEEEKEMKKRLEMTLLSLH